MQMTSPPRCPLYQYILACLAVSNFNVLVSSRMNLELPVFDGFRCHYRLLRVQVKLISELVNGCLKDKLSDILALDPIFSSSTTSPMFLVVHLFKLKDNHQMSFEEKAALVREGWFSYNLVSESMRRMNICKWVCSYY
ncbi:hypothetical protein Bca101_049836 [Brassica carinata]